jgi:hypothetical protein
MACSPTRGQARRKSAGAQANIFDEKIKRDKIQIFYKRSKNQSRKRKRRRILLKKNSSSFTYEEEFIRKQKSQQKIEDK